MGAAAPGHVAIDGKRLRGSAAGDHDGSEGVHLLAVFATRLGAVIGQLRVASEANEITTALALLKSLPLEGAIITGDAALFPAVKVIKHLDSICYLRFNSAWTH